MTVLDVVGSVEHLSRATDGSAVAAGDTVLEVRGAVRDLLTAERSALNLLCHLSGVATLTRRWADAVAGTDAHIRDTRKTTPGCACSRSTPCAAAAASTTGWRCRTPRW